MRLLGKTSQRKGRTGELEIVKIFQAHGIDVRPGDPVSYGSTPDVVGVDGIHCEIKRTEKLRLTEWLERATRDSEKFHDGAPAIFHRKNRQPWLVTMALKDWLPLYLSAKPGESRKGVNYDSETAKGVGGAPGNPKQGGRG